MYEYLLTKYKIVSYRFFSYGYELIISETFLFANWTA